MTFTHNTHRLPWKPKREKLAFRVSLLSLFLSLHYKKCLQYNIRYSPTSKTSNSKTRIRKPWAENYWPKTTKNNPKFFSRGLRPLTLDRGPLASMPPSKGAGLPHTPFIWGPSLEPLLERGMSKPAKNITHTQHELLAGYLVPS